MKIVLSGILENISTRSDGSVKIMFATQEIDPSQAGELFQLRNQFCKLLLSNTNITNIEEKLVDEEQIAGGKKAKTPSQRLRNVMYRVHESQGISIPFEDFYKAELERHISYYKGVLNDK
mgnify:CR=1 FL=1